MKYFLTLLFSIAISAIYGQTIQYLENNPEWKIYRSMGPCLETGEYNYFLNGDTLIGNKVYKKVYSKGYMQGFGGPDPWCPSYYQTFVDTYPSYFLRQENKKLFCVYPDCPYEILLYNFDLHQNDTVKFYEWCDTVSSIPAIVESIDSIFIDNNYRKVFHLNEANCGMGGPTTLIIEGIGCEHDLFKFCNGEFDGRFLECFGLNGTSIYSPDGDSCVLDIAVGYADNYTFDDNFYVYPNPTHGKLVITNAGVQLISNQIEIINSFGQRLLIQKNSSSIDISNLPNGIYFVRIRFNDSSTITKKIVKD